MGLFEEIKEQKANRGGAVSYLDKHMQFDLNEEDAAGLLKALEDITIAPMIICNVLQKRQIIISRSAVTRWRKSKGIT